MGFAIGAIERPTTRALAHVRFASVVLLQVIASMTGATFVCTIGVTGRPCCCYTTQAMALVGHARAIWNQKETYTATHALLGLVSWACLTNCCSTIRTHALVDIAVVSIFMVSSMAASTLVGTVLVTSGSPHCVTVCTFAHIGLAKDSNFVEAGITGRTFVLLMFRTSSACCFHPSLTTTLVRQTLAFHKAVAHIASRALMHSILRASSSS